MIMKMIVEKIKNEAEKNPNKIAYKINDNILTYKELWDLSNYYANLLNKQGTHPVIIYSNKSVNVIILIIACIISNRTYIPVGKCTPLDRLKQIIKMTDGSLIINDINIDIDNIDCCKLEELV